MNALGTEMKYVCRCVRGGEFVVSRTGGAYHARAGIINREFRFRG
jgi:hypothetical protein